MGTSTDDGRCDCTYYRDAPQHHDQLLSVETASFDEITGLIEMAVTWHELDYSEQSVIDPDRWLDFVASHRWTDPDRVLDFFLALSSQVRAGCGSSTLASVVPLRGGQDVSETPTDLGRRTS